MKLSNKVYDILKYVAILGLPALATFCGSIGKIWGLPYTEQIVLTITATDTFIGALLGISSYNYNKSKHE